MDSTVKHLQDHDHRHPEGDFGLAMIVQSTAFLARWQCSPRHQSGCAILTIALEPLHSHVHPVLSLDPCISSSGQPLLFVVKKSFRNPCLYARHLLTSTTCDLGSCLWVDLLAVLVVSDTRGRSAVAAAFARTDAALMSVSGSGLPQVAERQTHRTILP